eukprot:1161802-Pelagomonas_calceolata.AAC.9
MVLSIKLTAPLDSWFIAHSLTALLTHTPTASIHRMTRSLAHLPPHYWTAGSLHMHAFQGWLHVQCQAGWHAHVVTLHLQVAPMLHALGQTRCSQVEVSPWTWQPLVSAPHLLTSAVSSCNAELITSLSTPSTLQT